MVTLRTVLASTAIAAVLAFTTACGGSTNSSSAQASPSTSASVVVASSAKPTPKACVSDPANTTYASPEAITPRVDGVFVGQEDGGYLVILRYYPNNTAFLAVVPGNTPIDAAKAWVRPSPRSNTGPFPHDASGAFTKPVPAGDIDYSVWKYTGDTLVLHALSHHGCREHSMFMKFTAG